MFNLNRTFLIILSLLCAGFAYAQTSKDSFKSDALWQKRLQHAQPQVLMVIPWQESINSPTQVGSTTAPVPKIANRNSKTQTYVVKRWSQL